jgi:hypothetical protein
MVVVFFIIAIAVPLLAWRGFAIRGAYAATMIVAALMWIVNALSRSSNGDSTRVAVDLFFNLAFAGLVLGSLLGLCLYRSRKQVG